MIHLRRIDAPPGAPQQGDVAGATLDHPAGKQQAQPAGTTRDDVLGTPVQYFSLPRSRALFHQHHYAWHHKENTKMLWECRQSL